MTFYEKLLETHSFIFADNKLLLQYIFVLLSHFFLHWGQDGRLIGDGTKYESMKLLVFDDLLVTLLPS